MIRGFSPPQLLEPENPRHLQWGAAFKAGLIAGAVLLIVPGANPWSSVTSFDPTIMGRALPIGFHPWLPVWLIHLVLSVVYGFCISRLVVYLKGFRAVLAGGLIGLILYGLNLVVVSLIWPQMRGYEISVLFTHFVFGLIAAGAYRGLLKRLTSSASTT